MIKSSIPAGEEQFSNQVRSGATLNERKQQFVRDAIWNAAINLFAQKGFDETTIEDITQAAGTSRRSFFRYFESKSDLMVQPVANFGNSLSEAIRNCPSSESLLELLRQLVLQVSKSSVSKPQTRKVMEIAAKYPEARAAQMARAAELQYTAAEAFAQWCKKNGRSELHAHVLAALTMSLLNLTYRFWFEHREQDISAAAEQVFETLRDVVSSPAIPTTVHKADPKDLECADRRKTRKSRNQREPATFSQVRRTNDESSE